MIRRSWGGQAFTVVACSSLAGALLGGCGPLLGIPEDPYVEEPAAPALGRTPPDQNGQPPAAVEDNYDSSGDDRSDDGGELDPPSPELDSQGQMPSELAGGDPLEPEPSGADTPGDDTPAEPEPPGDDDAAPPEVQACVPRSERRPVDVVFIADNSGSMALEIDVLERNLNAGFAEPLDEAGVDYQLILISRQRDAERTASEEASTSICVAAPLGSLAACPAPEPAPSARFLQYDIKIDATDSFDRILGTFATPDRNDLTVSGWRERLRSNSRKVLIEYSDSNAALPLAAFLAQLSALAPEAFGSDPASPTFVFHSVVGVEAKQNPLVPYSPDEPVEEQRCGGAAANGPDNSGQTYQALSRLTGGLRYSICPTLALPFVLRALADDVIEQSFVPCPAASAP